MLDYQLKPLFNETVVPVSQKIVNQNKELATIKMIDMKRNSANYKFYIYGEVLLENNKMY